MKDIYTIKLLGKIEQYSHLMRDDGMTGYVIYYKDSILFELENRPVTGILKKDIEFELKDILDYNEFIVKEIEENEGYEEIYKCLKEDMEYSYDEEYERYTFISWKNFDYFLKNEMGYE